MLSILFKNDVNFENINEIHNRLNELSPNILNSLVNYNLKENFEIKFCKFKNQKTKNFLIINPFKIKIFNYYTLTSVERSSKIMKTCSNNLQKKKLNFN
jgi:hypothetical protein